MVAPPKVLKYSGEYRQSRLTLAKANIRSTAGGRFTVLADPHACSHGRKALETAIAARIELAALQCVSPIELGVVGICTTLVPSFAA